MMHEEAPDFVVFTGDQIDHGASDARRALVKIDGEIEEKPYIDGMRDSLQKETLYSHLDVLLVCRMRL